MTPRRRASAKKCVKCGTSDKSLWFTGDVCETCDDAERKASQRADRIRSLRAAANIPERHAKLNNVFTDAKWTAAFSQLNDRLGSGLLVALLGSRGRGKTQLGVCLIKEACRHEQSARYLKTMRFFTRIRATFDKAESETEDSVLDTFKRFDLLVIDEVGVRGETAWEDRLLTNLVDERYDAMRDTILISNQTEKAFTEAVGASIMHRMKEDGGIIVCDWTDFREPTGD